MLSINDNIKCFCGLLEFDELLCCFFWITCFFAHLDLKICGHMGILVYIWPIDTEIFNSG